VALRSALLATCASIHSRRASPSFGNVVVAVATIVVRAAFIDSTMLAPASSLDRTICDSVFASCSECTVQYVRFPP
jgi:hypothetical protein